MRSVVVDCDGGDSEVDIVPVRGSRSILKYEEKKDQGNLRVVVRRLIENVCVKREIRW